MFQKDITGQKFGSLTAIKFCYKKNNRYFWLFKCACGNEKIINKANVISGLTQSCGCYFKKIIKKCNKTHGLSNTRIFSIWLGIKNRCCNINEPAYKNYGGRGITICKEWENDFKTFYDWSMANGYQDNLTIDRINNNGNYEPSNCRWADKKIQANNQRNTVKITYKGQQKSLTEWAEQYNINKGTLRQRLKRGWEVEKALKTI